MSVTQITRNGDWNIVEGAVLSHGRSSEIGHLDFHPQSL